MSPSFRVADQEFATLPEAEQHAWQQVASTGQPALIERHDPDGWARVMLAGETMGSLADALGRDD